MVVIDKSALLPYSSQQIFELLNDVASYPEFMPGCEAVDILEANDVHMKAKLVLKKAAMTYSFVTHNTLQPPNLISLHLVEGPFDSFEGCWEISSLDSNACKVRLLLKFSMPSRLANVALHKLIDHLSNTMVDVIVQRANQLYASN